MKPGRRFLRLSLVLSVLLAILVGACGDETTGTPAAAAAIAVSGAHSVAVGETLTLGATTAGGADSAYRWQSSRADVATVDAAGVVTGVAEGEATVTVTGVDTGATAEHAMVVIAVPVAGTPVVGVSGAPYVLIGSTVSLTATTTGATDASYAWTSSDDVVASVDADGIVTGRAVGEVTITAIGSDTGASGTHAVLVSQHVPNYDAWAGSAHANVSAEAFNHWNGESPPEIPTDCARCHATPGFLDYIGADGSPAGQVDAPAPIGTVITCDACHNATAQALDTVTFPSGEIVDGLGPEARCMTCHQGRASGDSVDEQIAAAGVASDDEPSDALSFLNIHYYAAGATLNAGRVRGGYQYAGKVYDWRFRHVPGFDTCVGCHDPHSLEVKVDACKGCHLNVQTKDDLKDIRMMASLGQDYDGDGDTTEGIYHEMDTLRDKVLQAVQAYAVEKGLGGICYDAAVYPYWFKDGDLDGSCSAAEAAIDNRFAPWTARLVRATYNYQVSLKDPGAFAHNAKYIIQLLYDAIEDLDGALQAPVDLASSVRNDVGHFNGASEAARHWDQNDAVDQTCSRCHGGSEGFRFYLKYGVGAIGAEPDNGLDCSTCHESFGTTFDTVAVPSVTFPSGITITDPDNVSNICMTCHQGRVSKKDIDAAIASNSLGFKNVHYLPAGAVKKGTLAKVGYEYTGKTYAGEWVFHGQCIDCHDAKATNHSFLPEDNAACTTACHAPTPIPNIRTKHVLDYDGDGDTVEPLDDELAAMVDALYLAMRASADASGPALCYDPSAYPYFFIDTNDNAICDAAEKVPANGYKPWTPALMKAAHNFQIFQKEPGAWAHNFDYMGELVFDSIADLGGDPAGLGFVRP